MSKKNKLQPYQSQGHHPAQVTVSSTQIRSAPLPDPREFAKYEEVLPGSAERIMRQFEVQADHRRSLETTVVHSNVENERRGMNIGAILAGMFIVGGFVAVMTGHDMPGYAALGWAAAQISGTYLVTWVGKRRQLRQKREPDSHQ